MRIPDVLGRITYNLMRPALGLFYSGRLRVRALIIHESKILLVRNWKGGQRWTLPGGGVKSKESPREALVRELKEELNLGIKESDLEFISEVNHEEASAKYPVKFYRFSTVDKPSFSMHRPELIDAKWWPIDELPDDIEKLAVRTIKQQR